MSTVELETIPVQLKIKELSYSSILTAHACPRRYQLDKLMNADDMVDTSSVTFAYGHAVGEGIQQLLLGKSRDEVLWAMFLVWDYDLLEEEPKSKKSFPMAVLAMDKFIDYLEYSDLKEYEVATINGAPAAELSFKIDIQDGYYYRGFVDVVLRHKSSGKLLVLEIKTTGSYSVNEAQYKNSSQALGYTIILDTIDGNNTDTTFEVRYLVYKTKSQEFESLSFSKLFNQKVDWVKNIILDYQQLENYRIDNYYPRYGESCFNFFRQCKHFQYCGLKDTNLRLAYDKVSSDTTDYTINLSLVEIIDSMESRVK